jgi:hypothetical protein
MVRPKATPEVLINVMLPVDLSPKHLDMNSDKRRLRIVARVQEKNL